MDKTHFNHSSWIDEKETLVHFYLIKYFMFL